MALTNKLTAIADAIREKTNTTEAMTLEQMATAISGITGGGEGESLPEEAFVITGDCSYRFAHDGWNWFISRYRDKITTNDISSGLNMFYFSKVKELFEINFTTTTTDYHDVSNMFRYCDMESVPKINNCRPYNMNNVFNSCDKLKVIPADIVEWFDWSYMEGQTSQYSGGNQRILGGCCQLRSFPMNLLSHVNPNVNYSNPYFNYGFENCYLLDELIGLPLPFTATWTSNAFASTFGNCTRLKNVTFEMNEDGTPKVMNWSKQTIDLTNYVGRASYATQITNNGITKDKEVTDDTTYQALKNDPDWFTCNVAYSRYNHDSAVNTINSLPDVTQGTGNTIKFKGESGSATDGQAINTLTEEEVAIATAKGWTVTFV